MRTIELTKGYVAIVDDDDYPRVAKLKWTATELRRKDGSICTVRAYRQYRDEDGKIHMVYMHRFILATAPGMYVDHRNHDALDNRKANLRSCTKMQNCQHKQVPHNNTSGFKGVTRHSPSRWMAQITVNFRHKYLGLYQTKEEAAAAYNQAAIQHFGTFAKLNPLPAAQA